MMVRMKNRDQHVLLSCADGFCSEWSSAWQVCLQRAFLQTGLICAAQDTGGEAGTCWEKQTSRRSVRGASVSLAQTSPGQPTSSAEDKQGKMLVLPWTTPRGTLAPGADNHSDAPNKPTYQAWTRVHQSDRVSPQELVLRAGRCHDVVLNLTVTPCLHTSLGSLWSLGGEKLFSCASLEQIPSSFHATVCLSCTVSSFCLFLGYWVPWIP